MKYITKIMLIGLFSLALNAEVWTVDTTGAEGDSLQTKIYAGDSYPGIDTVIVENGTYHLFINDTVGLIMCDSIVLMSRNGSSACTLTAVSQSGNDTAWHVIRCDGVDSSAFINGFTITDGRANGSDWPHYLGGGVLILNYSFLTLENNTIVNNSANTGGGLYIGSHSSPTLVYNTISNDSAQHGGGLSIWENSSPTLIGNVIRHNSATDNGGGVFIRNNSSPTLNSNTIANNSADYGGGLNIELNSSPTLLGDTIKNNSADYGGGLKIGEYSSPTLINNIIVNDSAQHGGGLYIGNNSSPMLTNNTISYNKANFNGGGLCIADTSSPTLVNNTIENNSAIGDGGGLFIRENSSPMLDSNTVANNSVSNSGGGLYIGNSSPTLANNRIENNSAPFGGGFIIQDNSSPLLVNNTISSNSANFFAGGLGIVMGSSPTLFQNIILNNSADRGGGLGIIFWSSVILNKCVIGANHANVGGAIYDTMQSKVVIDSSFLIDNGNTYDSKSGLAYISPDADSGITFEISHSNVYYNTYQPDTEIYNLTSVTIPLQNNFWWDTTEIEIAGLIAGPNNHSNWQNDFILGVPGEPISIDSVRNYSDASYSLVIGSISQPDTLYLRIYGQDRLSSIREAAVVIIKSSIYPNGIAVALMENATNSGIYQGEAHVLESTGNDTIRMDDIFQQIKVNASVDLIRVYANTDTTKKFSIVYNPSGITEQPNLPKAFALSQNIPNPFINHTMIRYQVLKETRITLKVFDITGKCVNTLINKRPHKPGNYQIIWNGQDNKGQKLPAGVYFYRMSASEYKSIRKTIMLK